MRLKKIIYSDGVWQVRRESEGFDAQKAQWLLVFGARPLLEEIDVYHLLRAEYPAAIIMSCSTSGEICRDGVHENTLNITALEFEGTRIRKAQAAIHNLEESYQAGASISKQLQEDDLKLIFVLSDGNMVNGSELVRGLNDALPEGVSVSGGLAGDAERFEKTLVGIDAPPVEGLIAAVGLYGADLKIGHGTMGGWDVFGPERQITKSNYNVLYEISGLSALDLYRDYLGRYAGQLPGAALLFPLSLKTDAQSEPVVRTILSIDESRRSMTFAGEMPEGAYVRFMKANFDRLIEAAAQAAQHSLSSASLTPDLVIMVSCVGRKLALGQRIDEEIEAAQELFNSDAFFAGFYSYGEISPLATGKCDLHNQTMTITTIKEV